MREQVCPAMKLPVRQLPIYFSENEELFTKQVNPLEVELKVCINHNLIV